MIGTLSPFMDEESFPALRDSVRKQPKAVKQLVGLSVVGPWSEDETTR
jgi:hypothetical protein